MGKDAPFWKGKLVNRDWLKDVLEEAFRRAATGDFDEEMGRLVNELEIYIASQVLKNSREAVEMVRSDLDSALAGLKDLEKVVGREQIRRRGDRQDES